MATTDPLVAEADAAIRWLLEYRAALLENRPHPKTRECPRLIHALDRGRPERKPSIR